MADQPPCNDIHPGALERRTYGTYCYACETYITTHENL